MHSKIAQVGYCGVEEVGCGCDGPCDCAPVAVNDCGAEPTCGACGMMAACGCEVGGCDGGSSEKGFGGLSLLSNCSLDEPWTLLGNHGNLSMGGWVQLGFHTDALPAFNNRPDEIQLQQYWLYAEKAIDTSHGFDIGGRFDYVYGTDGPNTQAFGINNDHWDNDWDNGNDYGHAIPQLYLEAGYGDYSVKVGHFYTIIGYEVVTAPDNFFYSHAYTMNFSEPFTHTGLLATVALTETSEAYGGYVMGWDSGFEDNGDAFLGGLSLSLSEDISVAYAAIGGRFADKGGQGIHGFMHSLVADVALTNSLQYVFQTDYLDTQTNSGTSFFNSIGINQYLIYRVNDCLAGGARFEWWNPEGASVSAFGNEVPIYAFTMGMNFKPHANVIMRPEVRFDWDDELALNLPEGEEQTTFGIDTIFLY